ncbi:glycosyl transferase [Spirochaetia bacterium]|nr:glycosyl transferase [Spirochaetia bacterium]
MNNTKISIITVVYNAASSIKKTLESVKNQTYNNIEYIVIDGGSTDETMAIVNEYKYIINVLVSEKDDGIYDAMNKGLSYATGEWMFFLNAGDLFINDNVINDVFTFDLNNIDIVYGYIYCSNGKKIYPPKKINIYTFMFEMTICHQSLFARKKCFNNKFDIKYKIVADREWLLSQLESGSNFKYVDMPIVVYDNTGISSHFFIIKNDLLKFHRVHFNLFVCIVAYMRYFFAVLKHIILLKF